MKQAMIFAAGLGTRLKPLTDHVPKALVSVGGVPLLRRVVGRLAVSGFERIVVNVHHFASQITDYLDGNNNFGLDIRVSDETRQLLDTGGGLRAAAPLFDASAPILIHNVDILSNVDLAQFYALAADGPSLLVSWRPTRRYLVFNSEMRLVGWVNIETGQVKSPWPDVRQTLSAAAWPPTPPAAPLTIGGLRLFAFSGIHTFPPSLFPLMQSWPEKFSIIDFYLHHCATVPIVGRVAHGLRLIDVGKQDTLSQADDFLQSLHSPGARQATIV